MMAMMGWLKQDRVHCTLATEQTVMAEQLNTSEHYWQRRFLAMAIFTGYGTPAKPYLRRMSSWKNWHSCQQMNL